MSFNFNKKVSNKISKEPRVFHLPPGTNFVQGFVDGLLSKFESQGLDLHPEKLSEVTILVSTRVLARKIEEYLVNRNYCMLPKIIQLDHISDVFYELPIKNVMQRNKIVNFEIICGFLAISISILFKNVMITILLTMMFFLILTNIPFVNG